MQDFPKREKRSKHFPSLTIAGACWAILSLSGSAFLPLQQKFETKKEVLASSLVPDYDAK